MNFTLVRISLKVLFTAIILLFISNSCYANDKDAIVEKKADFIIQVASSISYPNLDNTKTYKIGLFGKSRQINPIYEKLRSQGQELKIHGKLVEFLRFKNTRKIEPVDLIFLEGNSKIRINELNEQLAGHPYIIVTENFPFGMSMLNFTLNKKNELFFEIQEEMINNKGAKINNDLLSSTHRVTSIEEWQQRLNSAVKVIKKQEHTIDLQTDEITEKETVIRTQYKTITISLIFLIITSGLIFLLLRINHQRKKILIELEQKNKEVIDSIKYAKRIQDTILPSQSKMELLFKEFFIMYKPKDIVAGDFYWVEEKEQKLFFTLADCTGHGVPGAIISVMCSNALSKTVKELSILQPSKILDKTAELLRERMSNSEEEIKDGMDLALCCLDLNSNKLEYAGANNPLYFISEGKLNEIKANRQPIGKYSELKPFTNHTLDVKKGDCIYIFSDGFVDQFGGENGKKFKHQPFRKLLLSIHNEPMEKQKQLLEEAFNEWKGELEQVDDICMIGLRV